MGWVRAEGRWGRQQHSHAELHTHCIHRRLGRTCGDDGCDAVIRCRMHPIDKARKRRGEAVGLQPPQDIC